MKIIHTSDIHIDSPLTARLSKDKIKERRRELLANLGRLADECKRVGAEALIIAGDLFDSESVTRRALRAFFDTVSDTPEVHFFVLPGNHDAELIASCGMDAPENLHIFEYGKATRFELSGVTFTGISPCYIGMLDALALDKEKKNILVLHGELRDKTGDDGESIGARELIGKNIDYVALGHYHSYSAREIDSRCTAVYSGTPEGRGFDECGECGYVLIDTDGERVRHSFVKFAKRALRILKLALDKMERPAEIADGADALLSPVSRDDLVRLELCGSFMPGLWKDTAALVDRWKSRFYHFEVKDTSHISVNPEDYRYDTTLKGEFIRLVYADPSLDEETKQRVVECGVFALMGED